MPPTKAAKRVAKKQTGKRPGPRKMSASHKAALAQGRQMSAVVDRYVATLNVPKQRGRKVSKASLEQRLAAAKSRVGSSKGVDKVLAAQEIRDLQAKIASLDTSTGADVKSLEANFVKVAKKFSENRGITYGAWRDAGVSADVLKRAGIARTRGS